MEPKFFKINGEGGREGKRGIFEIFFGGWGGGGGGRIAGDETLNRKENFRMNLKMFS